MDIEQTFARAVSLHEAGNFADAAALYYEIIKFNPEHLGASANLASLLRRHGRLEDALELLRKAASGRTASAELFYNLSNAEEEAGEDARAFAALRKAIELAPGLGKAQLKYGLKLARAGQMDNALQAFVAAEATLADKDSLYQRFPGVSLAATILFEGGEVPAAIRMLKRIANNRPHDLAAHMNVGYALRKMNRFMEACGAYRKAHSIQPDNAHALTDLANSYVNAGLIEEAFCLFEEALSAPEKRNVVASSYLMAILYDHRLGSASKARQHADVMAAKFGKTKKNRLVARQRNNGRLRVGYVSADFHGNHPVSQFMTPLLPRIADYEVDQFISLNAKTNDQTASLAQSGIGIHPINHASDDEATEIILGHQLDLLIDLSGQTIGNRLGIFARRAAPLQACFVGYPHSTGLSTMDYLIADDVVCPPENDDLCIEEVLRLPPSFLRFSPPPEMPSPTFSNRAGPIVFGSLNTLPKISDATISLWAKVLHEIDDAVLLIKCGAFADKIIQDKMVARFEEKGIARDRLQLEAPQIFRDAMTTYDRIDVVLDTLPYNGGTTTAHALWMGVPVITRVGDNFCGRMGASLLTAAGFETFIATSDQAFTEIACTINADLAGFRANRQARCTAVAASALCDVDDQARLLVQIFQKIC